MPRFLKKLEELEDNIDKWLYVLKNISRLQELPQKLQNRIFEKLFRVAEIAKYSHEEWQEYQLSLSAYRDNKAALDYAKEEGRIEGRNEGQKSFIIQMLSKGLSEDEIRRLTGISEKDFRDIMGF